MKTEYYNYNDGDCTDESIEEIIQYMVDNEAEDEDIIGTVLEVCEQANIYSDSDFIKIQNILYGGIELCEENYYVRSVENILKAVESMKYLEPTRKYTITKEDMDNFNEKYR